LGHKGLEFWARGVGENPKFKNAIEIFLKNVTIGIGGLAWSKS